MGKVTKGTATTKDSTSPVKKRRRASGGLESESKPNIDATTVSSQAEEDENSALIARLLQQDYGYVPFEQEIISEDSDDDYHESRRRRKNKRKDSSKKDKKVVPRKAKTSASDKKSSESPGSEKPKRRAPRTWTEEEESRFLEALEKFGRKWNDCASYIGTGRLGRDIASHAQKHFIKLYKAGLPLPDKVKESGDGYTLSGKPLDPDSAAARAYGLGGTKSQKEYRERLKDKKQVDDGCVKNTSSEDAKLEKLKLKATRHAERERKAREAKAAREQKRLEKAGHAYDENGLTEYSRNRTRRRTTSRYVTAPTGELQFVVCSNYSGAPGSCERKAQPFAVRVHSSACLVVDVHAHTSTAEVMGFLAGRWDVRRREIVVTAAFPGRSTTAGETECEMDPIVEVQLRSTIESQGLSVVGWYHSHPTFDAVPSMCDIDNQTNYQTLFRDGKSGIEPFVALIASPYNSDNQGIESTFSWFYVKGPVMSKTPMRIATELIADDFVSSDAKERIEEVVNEFGSCPLSVNFHHKFNAERTYAQKLSKALCRWLPPVCTAHAEAARETRLLAGVDSSQVLPPVENDGDGKHSENCQKMDKREANDTRSVSTKNELADNTKKEPVDNTKKKLADNTKKEPADNMEKEPADNTENKPANMPSVKTPNKESENESSQNQPEVNCTNPNFQGELNQNNLSNSYITEIVEKLRRKS